MSSDLERWEAEVNDYRTQLETVRSSLHNDPDNAELRSLQAEIEEIISLTQQEIDAAYAREAAAATTAVPKNPAAAPGAQKWDKDKHPAFQPGYKRPGAPASPGEDAPVQTAFQVNDTVLAKWATGDKAFYPARITSITGSAANPVYLVTFKSYGNSETLRGADVKAMGGDTKKRKAEAAPAGATPPPAAPAAAAPGVISAAASINAELASQVRREPSRVGDGPTRPPKVPRKVKATRELEAGKSKWQEFATKGKLGKTAKKDSMFRTGESVNARVGFTGSGQAMRKDAARSRHIYQPLTRRTDKLTTPAMRSRAELMLRIGRAAVPDLTSQVPNPFPSGLVVRRFESPLAASSAPMGICIEGSLRIIKARPS